MPAQRPLRVLIVEDHQDGADSTAELLTLSGHEVRIACSGEGIERLVDSFLPDVALIDIHLPGEDGYAVAQTLCGLLKRKPVLVAITGFQHLRDRSRQEGFDHHYVKPVDPCELAKLLKGYAERVEADA